VIRAERSGDAWTVVGGGRDGEDARSFISELLTTGRSAYTQRSYAHDIALFLRWLDQEGETLDGVTRTTIVRYTRSLVDSQPPLAAATVNHRLSVLGSFFEWWTERAHDGDRKRVPRRNPVPRATERVTHRLAGRDVSDRPRIELRRRVPSRVAKSIDSDDAQRLVLAAKTLRDQAIITLLARTGARIGDWITEGDRHGVLGLALGDIDAKRRLVRIKLKGARNEHQVPATADFWELWDRYVTEERGEGGGPWAWVGRRRGRARPLRYPAFAAMLRALAKRAGIRVHAHMFRHGLAEAVTALSGIHVAQRLLGHRNLETTAAFYARVDDAAVVSAVEEAARRAAAVPVATTAWVFPYDELTLAELGRLVRGDSTERGQ
jgi:integrase/recombinase XerD